MINTAKHIYSSLVSDSRITQLVGNRVFPLVAIDATYPFIVIGRDSATPEYDKGGLRRFDCTCSVEVVSAHYDESVQLAEYVIDSLSDNVGGKVLFCRITGVLEDMQSNAFVQVINIEIINEK